MVGRRGYVLSWDALIALSIVLLVLVGFMSLPYFRSIRSGEVGFQQIHLKTEDAIETLAKEGKLTKIAVEWAEGNWSGEPIIDGASLMAKQFFDPMIPAKAGYMVIVDNDTIYSTEWDQPNRPAETQAIDKTRSARYVSGLGKNQTEIGWAARSYLMGNFTRHARKLRYPGVSSDEFMVIYLNFSNESTEKVTYLVLPKNARLTNGQMNLSWNTSAEEFCENISKGL